VIPSGSHPRSLVRVLQLSALGAALSVALACGGAGDDAGTADTGAAADTGGTPGGGGAAGAFTEQQITAQMVALGDSIFRGQAAPQGICYTCHGPDAAGTATGPNLTDQEWIHGDGSLAFIINNVRTGVPTPQQHAVPMPAFGPLLTEEQLRAVSAYVYSRSHPDFRPSGGD